MSARGRAPGADRMNIDWHDFGTAFALYLVLEGLLPFLSPAGALYMAYQMGKESMAQQGG